MKCCLQIISPVHIGCDDVYEPMAFTMDEKNAQLCVFDPLDFFRSLDQPDRQTYSAICGRGTVESLLEIYKFMRNKKYPGKEVPVCHGFVEHYRQTLGLGSRDQKAREELNRFSISRTSYNPTTGLPYIPGSALKGALRTAVLNCIAGIGIKKIQTPNTARELENFLLDRNPANFVESDPFRMVKVSDFVPSDGVKTSIVYAVNRKKRPSKYEAGGIYQILEVVEPGSTFYGTITVTKPENGSKINKPLDLKTVLESSRFFYSKELKREQGELQAIGCDSKLKAPEGNGIWVRIGRHSGAESVTIEGHRRIRIKGKGSDYHIGPAATTLWLAAPDRNQKGNQGLRPFGWAALLTVSDEEFSEKCRQALNLQGELISRIRVEEKATDASSRPVEAPKSQDKQTSPEPAKPKVETWSGATLSWSPGNQTLTAAWQGQKATGTGKDLVPDCYHKKLFEKKKSVTATVEVDKVGNALRVIRVLPDPN